jgi:hypothetical protein
MLRSRSTFTTGEQGVNFFTIASLAKDSCVRPIQGDISVTTATPSQGFVLEAHEHRLF